MTYSTSVWSNAAFSEETTRNTTEIEMGDAKNYYIEINFKIFESMISINWDSLRVWTVPDCFLPVFTRGKEFKLLTISSTIRHSHTPTLIFSRKPLVLSSLCIQVQCLQKVCVGFLIVENTESLSLKAFVRSFFPRGCFPSSSFVFIEVIVMKNQIRQRNGG